MRCHFIGTRSIDRMTFLQNSFFSFECRSFEKRWFCTFFWISVLSKKNQISKEIRTKNKPYQCTKIFVPITFFRNSFFSFECRSFKKRCFCTFFWISVLSKKLNFKRTLIEQTNWTTVKPVLTTTSEQRPPVNNGRPKCSPGKLSTKFSSE